MTTGVLPTHTLNQVAACRSVREAVTLALADPRTLPELCAATGLSASNVMDMLRALAGTGEVRCTRIGDRREHRDADRLLWHLAAEPVVLRHGDPPPPVQVDDRRAERLRANAKAHSNDRPEPIEILARMAGRTSFRTPKTPGATAVPVTPLDIAHAIATVPDKLGAAMAMAMACQRPVEWPRVEELGHPRLLAHLRRQKESPGIVDGANVFRARIALFDAFQDLISPALARPLSAAARAARMRRQQYRWLLNEAAAFLEAAANTAAADAVRYLFALAVVEHPVAHSARAVSVTSTGEILIWTSASADELNHESAGAVAAIDVDALCAEMLRARPRSSGILGLSKS